jgi:enoyl-CoA hydratase/carnithine racemase
MVLTGRSMSAQRLCDLGAVNSVVQTGQAVAASLELAMTLAEKSPTAVAGLKRILAASDDSTLTEAMGYEQEVFQSVIATTQAREGMQNRQSAYDSSAGLASISDKDD